MLRYLILGLLAIASVTSLRAQGCLSQMPNECCPPVAADSYFSMALQSVNAMQMMMSQMQAQASSTQSQAQGPFSEFLTDTGTQSLPLGSSCLSDPSRPLSNSGGGGTLVSTYGHVKYQMPMPEVSTGLLGFAPIYTSLLILDGSAPVWTGVNTHLKSIDPSDQIPVPNLDPDHLVGSANGLQPRPGTMPGAFIFQHGSSYYQYGGPLNTGADPQTTAVYADPTNSPASQPLGNNLSGAQLYRFPPPPPVSGQGNLLAPADYVEVRHVDGTVARFDAFVAYTQSWVPPGPPQKLFRITQLRDPYDNIATFIYDNATNRLQSIEFPSGLTQHWGWTPSWFSGAGKLEISYTHNNSSPPEVAGRTWAIAFLPSVGGVSAGFFGGRLWRTYSSVRTLLVDPTPGVPHVIGGSSEVLGQVVNEWTYASSVLTQTQHVHAGSAFNEVLTPASGLSSQVLLETAFGVDGRAVRQTRVPVGEQLLYTYPIPVRSLELMPEDVGKLRAIEIANGTGTKRCIEFSVPTGRVYTIRTTPSANFLGRPREDHRTGENSSIGGAKSDVEPEWMEVYNVYSQGCVCNKPTEQRHLALVAGQQVTRTTNFEYEPGSKLVKKVSVPNPETAHAGPVPAQVDFDYTYVQLHGGSSWGAWVIQTEATPDGVWTYAYDDLLNRVVAGHGQMARTVTRQISQVRIQSALDGVYSLSSVPVVETTWRNLSNLPAGLPKMGAVNGQPRKIIDGDGVETTFAYNAFGYLTGTLTGVSLSSVVVPNALGEAISQTTFSSSSLAATTTVTRMSGTGVPVAVASSSTGVVREAKAYYDRHGHIAVVRRNNMSSVAGVKPAAHGAASGAARDWIESQYHYHYLQLMDVFEDGSPLDAGAGGVQFLRTQYDYIPDGRLQKITHPSGSYATYDFDGYGTLYRSITWSPGGAQSARGPKVFVTPFLEVSGIYEDTDDDDLWTLIQRNAAGAITLVTEPSTAAPAGYSPLGNVNYSTGGAVHVYRLDKLGRVTQADSLSGTTLLSRQKFSHDQLSRQIWQENEVSGPGSGMLRTAWRYQPGKSTQLVNVESTDRAPTTYFFNAMGLLAEIRDGFGTGNRRELFYHPSTTFLSQVTSTDLDSLGGTRVTNVYYDVNPFGEVTAIKHGDPHLVHSYAYNSLGRVDRYTDPMQKVQKFLPDALGRVVEHVRLGDNGAFIRNASIFADAGAADGRTKVTRLDDLGNTTISHWDFADRPFIVQNPGAGTTPPTLSSPHQSMSLFAQYDGASRLKTLYDGDQGRVEFWRDGPGRVIQRALVAAGPKISQWNTHDVIRRDALGRIQHTGFSSGPLGSQLMGIEQFDNDSAGRVHKESYLFFFAQANVLEVASSYPSTGGSASAFRKGLDYRDNLVGAGTQPMQLGFERDNIGRLAEIKWNRAPGATSGMHVLAEYGWAGGLRRSRHVRYGTGAEPYGTSKFGFDTYGRLTWIDDKVKKAAPGSVETTASRFDYDYDAASNLVKERYAKVGSSTAQGDRFAYDAYHRLSQAWMGVDTGVMNGGQPSGFDPTTMHEHLTYGLDGANNRTTTTSQTAANSGPVATDYTVQAGPPQGPSNRYEYISVPSASLDVKPEYDERGNLTYDGRFYFVYDYMNRLSEVWEVIPNDVAPAAMAGVTEGDEKYLPIQDESLEGAREAVKLEVPNIHERLVRDHMSPVFRNRLRAQVVGGVLRITPTAAGGGGRPGWLPVPAEAELKAVYIYDAFNRRTMSVLVGQSLRYYTWDGWRNVVEAEHVYTGASPATWTAVPAKQFVWGSRLDELVSFRRRIESDPNNTWETYFVLHGGQDTAAKLVDSTGEVVEQYEYDPFGRATCFAKLGGVWTPLPVSQYGLPFLWKGIRLDEITGLLQMRNRYYSVASGRFLTRDLIGVWGDESNMGNEFSYVGNMPLVFRDPMGLQGETGESGGSEHKNNARPSTEQKHEEGQARKQRDRGGEKADERRRPPNKRPKGHTGPWPKPKVKPKASNGACGGRGAGPGSVVLLLIDLLTPQSEEEKRQAEEDKQLDAWACEYLNFWGLERAWFLTNTETALSHLRRLEETMILVQSVSTEIMNSTL